ncbi:unnamed protein product [Eretmochelys imbricata]
MPWAPRVNRYSTCWALLGVCCRQETGPGLQREGKDRLALGVTQPSSSPWASPVVLLPKKDGSIRFCVDYRKFSAITVSDAYPIPRTDETLDKLRAGPSTSLPRISPKATGQCLWTQK